MSERNYDYESSRSKLMIKQIKGFIKAKRATGATQADIAKHLNMSVTGANRYINHMCEQSIIHISAQATTRGHNAAIYMPGPAIRIERRKPAYMNDTLLAAFYGRRKMDKQALTQFYPALTHEPQRVGPYQCQMVRDFNTDATHMRWWNGSKWSHPLDYDPAIDAEIVAPAVGHYPSDADVTVHNERFEFRGYACDPDPL